MPELNAEQRQAVEYGGGPLLIVAGPGAGKTRVITERIAWMLGRGQYSFGGGPLQPQNILALTFTEKAAGEMKSRVRAALPELDVLPTISTFHAFCYQVLRARQADRRLLDKIDVWIFLRKRMAELHLEFYKKLAEPGAFLHDLNDFFARCQDELVEPDDFDLYVRRCEQQVTAAAGQGSAQARDLGPTLSPAGLAERLLTGKALEELLKKQELARVFRASRQMLDESGSSSLGSLVSETVALWRRDAVALADVRAQFHAVLVDELQDTNYAQMELLKLLVSPPYLITAVGDDDQAIYRFRGASHGAFEMFGQAFPGHGVVYLARNYRSTRRILRCAEAVISHNGRFEQKPALTSSGSEGAPVFLLKASSPEGEAAWIADEIQRLARLGVPLREIAVFYRAHRYREPLVTELSRRNIPMSIKGLSVLSAPVLRDLIAYLRLIQSPRENVSLARLLAGSRWRIPEALAQAIREHAAGCRCSLYDAVESGLFADEFARTAWGDLRDLLNSFRWLARRITLVPLLDRLIERLGWKFADGHPNRRNLDAFRNFTREWEKKSDTRRLAEFVEYFDYFLEAGGKIETPEVQRDAVQMMTAHAAKGLEFKVVFVISVSPHRFPASDRKPVIEFPPELRKGPLPPKDIALQEERRLFFVALTRAKERLYVSSVSKAERRESIFVRELEGGGALRSPDLDLIKIEEPAQVAVGEKAGAVPRDRAARFCSSSSAALPNSSKRAQPLRNRSPAGPRQAALFEAGSPPEPEIGLPATAWPDQLPAESCIRLSATAAESYLSCPLKYRFQHLLKIPTGPQAALTFGNFMHRCVRHYFELRRERIACGALPDWEEIKRFYLDQWKSVGFEDDHHEQQYRDAGLVQLGAFIAKQNAIALDARAVRTEQSFEFALDGVILEGRIDQINLLKPDPGEVELIDYKTGRARTEKDAEKSLQLSLYALGAARALGLKPARLTFYNLSTNDSVSAARSPTDLALACEEVAEVASGIRARRFEPTPGFGCRWCEYVSLCPAHEGKSP